MSKVASPLGNDWREAERSVDDIAKEIESYARSLDPEAARYWTLHARRFRSVASLARKHLRTGRNGEQASPRILDIGNSFQTLLLSKAIAGSRVDTMGFFDHRFKPDGQSRHYEYDLNKTFDRGRWIDPADGPYDFIAFLEVIEHLYTSPSHVLGMLREFLAPGGVLVVQTPNAVALKKRLRLLTGKNPYELIRLSRTNPGHFREYTLRELETYAAQTGFEVVEYKLDSNLIDGKRFDRICDRISRFLPPNFRNGITIVLKRSRISVPL